MLVKVPNNLYIDDSSFTYTYTVNSMTITGANVATDYFVTAHLPDQPTVGQAQDIYGEKTFKGGLKVPGSGYIGSLSSDFAEIEILSITGNSDLSSTSCTDFTCDSVSIDEDYINAPVVKSNTLYTKTITLTSGSSYYTIGTDKTYFQIDDQSPSTSTGINIILTKNNTTDTSSLPSYRILPTGIFTNTQGGPPDLGDGANSGFNKIFCKKLCQGISTDPITFSFGLSSPTEPVKIMKTGIEVGTNKIKITENGIEGLSPSSETLSSSTLFIGSIVLAKKKQNDPNSVLTAGSVVDIDPSEVSTTYCICDFSGDIQADTVFEHKLPKGRYIALSRVDNTTASPVLLQVKSLD